MQCGVPPTVLHSPVRWVLNAVWRTTNSSTLTGPVGFQGGVDALSAAPAAFDPRGSIVLLATLSGRFFFNLASIDDSRSGNGGISSRIVAFVKQKQHITANIH